MKQVTCICHSKKEVLSTNPDTPVVTEIEMRFPPDKESTFYALASTAPFLFNTIDKEVSSMFVVGGSYQLTISVL